MSWEEYQFLMARAMRADDAPVYPIRPMPEAPEEPKKKRKVSKYNRQYAKEYRIHREKHPRMSHAQITKLAHKATRKALK